MNSVLFFQKKNNDCQRILTLTVHTTTIVFQNTFPLWLNKCRLPQHTHTENALVRKWLFRIQFPRHQGQHYNILVFLRSVGDKKGALTQLKRANRNVILPADKTS